MKEFNYVPLFHQGINELTDGIEIKASNFCLKNCTSNPRCQSHYKYLLEQNDGNYQCPFGFASTIFSDEENDRYIFTGMRLETIYSAKLADPKCKSNSPKGQLSRNHRRITEKEVLSFVEYYLEYKRGIESHRNLQMFVEDIFHDIRKFNGQIKYKRSILYQKASNSSKKNGQFLDLSQNILAISSFMSLRLNAYDFIYNEELLSATERSSYNIYRIFDKVKHCLKDRASEKSLTIDINSNGQCGDMKAYDCLELLPFILLDNAIKYSEQKSRIIVVITDRTDSCSFSVSSQSPPLSEEEKSQIFNRGFRGKNAQSITDEGLGIGLYTAKKICDLHNGTISVRNESDNSLHTGHNKSSFIMDIHLSKEYNI